MSVSSRPGAGAARRRTRRSPREQPHPHRPRRRSRPRPGGPGPPPLPHVHGRRPDTGGRRQRQPRRRGRRLGAAGHAGAGRRPGPGRHPHPRGQAHRGDAHRPGGRVRGSVCPALPREEAGQGITTATAMLIADELGLPLAKARVTLADGRPELLTGQLTGGSNTVRSVYEPIRRACAAFRGRMAAAGAESLGVPVSSWCSVTAASSPRTAARSASTRSRSRRPRSACWRRSTPPPPRAPASWPAPRRTASTPAPWSPAGRSTPRTSSPCRACCARWCAGRRPSAAA